MNNLCQLNVTGDIIFWTRSSERFGNKDLVSDLIIADACKTGGYNLTKHEQRAVETLINNYMAKEREFYCLNEQFVSHVTGDIIFSTRSPERFGNKHLVSDLIIADACKTGGYNLTKREQRAVETLINNYMAKEREFYCLNEQFVSSVTGDIIFSTRSPERFENKHLASDLPTRAKQRIFP